MVDPAKKRRKYVWAKAKAMSKVAYTVGVLVTALILCCRAILLIAPHISWVGWWPVIALLVMASFILLAGAYSCMRAAVVLKSIPYVPPVHEQLAALTTDDVLLRGSDSPTASPAELLRAATDRKETASQELLRFVNSPPSGEI